MKVSGAKHWFDNAWGYTAECTGCRFETVGTWRHVHDDAVAHSQTDHTRRFPRLATF